jgi:hypothetical protein
MDSSTPLNITKFNLDILNTFQKLPKICIIGHQNAGKTSLILDILQRINNISRGVIIAPTNKDDQTYKNLFNSSYIEYTYNSIILKKILKRQKNDKDSKFIYVMDGCDYARNKWCNDSNYRSLLRGNNNIFYILSIQYAIGFKYYENFDYIFIFDDSLNIHRKKVYDYFFKDMFVSFEMFAIIFNLLGQNYKCLVLDIKKNILYYYQSEEISNFENIYRINFIDIIKETKPFTIQI